MNSGSTCVADLVSCQVCWAQVAKPLMVFHRDWHTRTDLASLDELAAIPVVTSQRNVDPLPVVVEACQSE